MPDWFICQFDLDVGGKLGIIKVIYGQLAPGRVGVIPGRVVRGRANPLHFEFPERLRRARRAAEMTSSGLSLAAGLSKNNAGLLEDGSGSPRLPTVEKLARVLGVSAGWLAYGLGDATATEQGPLRCHGLKDRFKEARGMLGVRELARRAATSPAQVRAAESGAMPSLDTLETLARGLEVSPAWLAYGTEPRELPARRGARLVASTSV